MSCNMQESSLSNQGRTLSFRLSNRTSTDSIQLCDFPLPPLRTHIRTSRPPSAASVVKTQPNVRPQSDILLDFAATSDAGGETRPKPNSKRTIVTDNNRIDSSADIDILLLSEQLDCMKTRLDEERRARAEENDLLHKAVHQMYNDFNSLVRQEKMSLLGMESKVETLITGYRCCQHEVHLLKRKFNTTLGAVSELLHRVNAIEPHAVCSACNGQSVSDNLHGNLTTPGKLSDSSWSAQIIFVLDVEHPNAVEADGVAYLKIQSRRPVQKVFFSDSTGGTFTTSMEASFPSLLHCKKWMPLARCRVVDNDNFASSRIALDRLPMQESSPDLWNRQFLEERCIMYDTCNNAHIYVCLQEGKLNLKMIDSLSTDRSKSPTPYSKNAICSIPHNESDIWGAKYVTNSDPNHLMALSSSRTSEHRSARASVDTIGFSHQRTAKLPPPSPRFRSQRGKEATANCKVEFHLDTNETDQYKMREKSKPGWLSRLKRFNTESSSSFKSDYH